MNDTALALRTINRLRMKVEEIKKSISELQSENYTPLRVLSISEGLSHSIDSTTLFNSCNELKKEVEKLEKEIELLKKCTIPKP